MVGRSHVLVVDDSEFARSMIARVVEAAGHQVVVARDGRAGLAHVQQGAAVDLVISDVRMPHVDGITMLEGIRAIDGHAHTPVLILTAETALGAIDAAKRHGATLWLVKPCPPKLLNRVVCKLLHDSSSAGAARDADVVPVVGTPARRIDETETGW